VYACFVEDRNTEAWNKNPGSHCGTFCIHVRETLPHDGRCSSEREVASSKVKGVFLADLSVKDFRCFCTHQEKAFLSSKMWVPDWKFFGTGQKCHASSTLND
jgi:hypothetical protein